MRKRRVRLLGWRLGRLTLNILLRADKVPYGAFDKFQHGGIVHANSQKTVAEGHCSRNSPAKLHECHDREQCDTTKNGKVMQRPISTRFWSER